MFLIQFNLFYNNFIYNCICLIRGLSNNNFLCRSVGVADDADFAANRLIDANTLQVVITFNSFYLSIGLNTIYTAQILDVKIIPYISRLVVTYAFVPNI